MAVPDTNGLERTTTASSTVAPPRKRIGSLISSPDSVGIEYSPTLWLALRGSSQALELVIGPYLLK